MFIILIFLLAIVAANLSVSYFGPISTPFNAFILIGLDLSLRDRIHEKWHNNNLSLKMLALICVGAVITYLLNQGAGRIAVASVCAFACALFVDAVIYQWLFQKKKFVKMNGSNAGSALVDSVLFPTIAFGAFMPWIVLGQFLAKVFGGALWAWILLKKVDKLPLK
jgi:uncharacterized PurR-regulated membrane protein YhhQ (DUF165 family)